MVRHRKKPDFFRVDAYPKVCDKILFAFLCCLCGQSQTAEIAEQFLRYCSTHIEKHEERRSSRNQGTVFSQI